MAVQFLIGRSGTGKTDFIVNHLKKELLSAPSGRPLIYIVPEQMSFLSEYKLAADPETGGMMRAQVYSFTRLAWRVLQEEGGMSRQHITPSGRSLLIRSIIEDKKQELAVFAKAAGKNGFIQTVERMLTEFRQYNVDPGELSQQRKHVPAALSDKLNDLQSIYDTYVQAIAGKYMDNEDYLALLAEKAEQSAYIAEADIFIDGFHHFTPQEQQVIRILFRKAKNVTVALTVDRSYEAHYPDETALFRLPGATYFNLHAMAEEEGVKRKEDVFLSRSKRHQTAGLQQIERFFGQGTARPSESSGVFIWEAAGRRAEVEACAREIRRLARTKQLRYKEMALLIRNSEQYRSIIETVFDDYSIPFYIDQKTPMMNHPLIEFIRSSLEVITGNWRYEAVFRAVKTDLLFPLKKEREAMRRKMDLLENYVLAHGIFGNRWTKSEKWVYRRYKGLEFTSVAQTDEEKAHEAELNEMKDIVAAPLYRLERRLKRARTALDCCRAIYDYVEELDVPQKIEQLALEAEAGGDLTEAARHNQAWDAVIGLLDEFAEVAGRDEMTVRTFASVLDAGLEALTFSIVPPAADQVIVANPDKSRLSGIHTAFVLGMNDGVFPLKQAEDGLLDDEERTTLQETGLTLSPDSRMKLLDEEFIAYRTFTIPSHQLYLLHPISDSEGKALQPSPYVKRIGHLFTEVAEKAAAADPGDLPADQQIDFICHPEPTLSYLTAQFQLKKRGYALYPFWWDVYNEYMQTNQEKARFVLGSLFYENKAHVLQERTSTELYGTDMIASVSRMEMYHSCPFSHFASHGLKLRDRAVYRLEAPDIGDLFHGALKWIAEEVEKRGMKWPDLTRGECRSFAQSAVEELAPKLQNSILMSSSRHRYIQHKLVQIIEQASAVLSNQAKQSGFAPLGIELAFGPRSELPPLVFHLKNGARMSLAGRIDRVDKAEGDQETYLRVIDYKSSGRDVDLTEVYYGFSMQMLTYLDIVTANAGLLAGTSAKPGGVLYFHVHNPFIHAKKFLTIEELEKEVLKSFRMKGLLLEEDEAIQLMDTGMPAKESLIVPASYKKDGTLSAKSSVMDESNFHMLTRHVRGLYQKAGDNIVAGETEIAPYRYKKQTPCTFCSYRQVCQFDETLDENHYRMIQPKKEPDILALVKEEIGDEHSR